MPKIHFSTIVVGLIAVLLFLALQVPGRVANGSINHGWPVTYLERVAPRMNCFGTTPAQHFAFTKDVERFSLAALLFDTSLTITIVSWIGYLFEKWRRRQATLLRFSLRGAIVIMSLLAIPMALIGNRVFKVRMQQKAFAELQPYGFDYYWTDPAVPPWAEELLPRFASPYFYVSNLERSPDELFHLYTEDGKVIRPDNDLPPINLELLRCFPKAEYYDLSHLKLSDERLLAIRALQPTDLYLSGNPEITLGVLSFLTDLREVYFDNLKSNEAEFPDPTALELATVTIDDSSLSRRQLRFLAAHPKLSDLTLRHSQLPPQGLEELAACRSLVSLDLGSTNIRGEELNCLNCLHELKELYISNTAITGDELMCLASLPSLTKIVAIDTNVSEEDVPRFQAASKRDVIIKVVIPEGEDDLFGDGEFGDEDEDLFGADGDLFGSSLTWPDFLLRLSCDAAQNFRLGGA